LAFSHLPFALVKMSSIELSPYNVLVFYIEEISDVIQTSTALSYNALSEDSILIFEVQSYPPKRYYISPNVGVVHNNQTTILSVKLVSSDIGLVQFLSTVPGDYFLMDQIVIHVAEVHGNTAATFSSLSVVENAEAIMEYFLVNSGYTSKKLFVQYHFSNELQEFFSLVLSPPAHTNASSPASDEASITCATAIESLFPIESGTVSQPEVTQQSESVSKVRKIGRIHGTTKHNVGQVTRSSLNLLL
jgi:hypothetical protein